MLFLQEEQRVSLAQGTQKSRCLPQSVLWKHSHFPSPRKSKRTGETASSTQSWADHSFRAHRLRQRRTSRTAHAAATASVVSAGFCPAVAWSDLFGTCWKKQIHPSDTPVPSPASAYIFGLCDPPLPAGRRLPRALCLPESALHSRNLPLGITQLQNSSEVKY